MTKSRKAVADAAAFFAVRTSTVIGRPDPAVDRGNVII
jgi:hypothetical protein